MSNPLNLSPPMSKAGIDSKIPSLFFFHSSFNNSLYSTTLYYTSIESLLAKDSIIYLIFVYCNGNFFQSFNNAVNPYSIVI